MPSFAANSVRAVGAALKRRFDIDAFSGLWTCSFRSRQNTPGWKFSKIVCTDLPTLPSVEYHSMRGMLNRLPVNQPTNLQLNFVPAHNLTSLALALALSLSLAYYMIDKSAIQLNMCVQYLI